MPTGIYQHKKGFKLSEEHKTNLSRALKGRVVTLETRKKMSETHKRIGSGLWMVGRSPSEETCRKISEANKGENNFFYGQHHSEETRKKFSGENSPSWKGGITPINYKIRNSLEYKIWRTAVFLRDNYICVWCGARNGNGKTITLNTDHIKPFCDYPKLRFIIDNGRTLCVDCHRKTDTFGNHKLQLGQNMGTPAVPQTPVGAGKLAINTAQ